MLIIERNINTPWCWHNHINKMEYIHNIWDVFKYSCVSIVKAVLSANSTWMQHVSVVWIFERLDVTYFIGHSWNLATYYNLVVIHMVLSPNIFVQFSKLRVSKHSIFVLTAIKISIWLNYRPGKYLRSRKTREIFKSETNNSSTIGPRESGLY